MLGVFPWHRSSMYLSDTSRQPQCLARASVSRGTICVRTYTSPLSGALHSRTVFCLHSAVTALEIPARRIPFVSLPINTAYMRALSAAHNPSSRAVHANHGGHGRHIAFPRIVHPCQYARSGRLRVHFARTPSCLRGRIFGYCLLCGTHIA
ncbi:hypothetical protein B0H13DRAFT_2110361 [Mycena leptocephala]|nr:hypothetical protein B0H13DRAFT_2110361 [Mycena leptocephala]